MARSRAKPIIKRRLVAPLISLFIVCSFALIAFSPAVQPVAADSTSDWTTLTTVATNGAGGAAIGWIVGDGIGAPIGFAVGCAVGFIESIWNTNSLNPLQQAKDVYAKNLANLTYDCLAYAHYNFQTDQQLESAITLYCARQAEYGAKTLYDYQTLNHLPHVYNEAWVLQQSALANSTTAYLWNVITAYNGALQMLDATNQGFVGTYSGMSFGYYMGYHQGFEYDGSMNSDMMATSTSAIIGGRVTVAITTAPGKYVDLNTHSLIYIQGASAAGVLDLTSLADNTTHEFDYGVGYTAVNASVLLPGIYNLHTNTSVSLICGLAAMAPTNSGTCNPAIMIYAMGSESEPVWQGTQAWDGAHQIEYTPAGYWPNPDYQSTQNAAVVFSGQSSPSSPTDTDTYSVSLHQAMLDTYAALAEVTSMITTANNYGQTFYNTLVLTGGVGTAPMPGFAFPDLSQTNLSDAQIYAIYIAYMRAAGSWYENYSALLSNNVTISAESIDLTCRGHIYNATGAMVYNATTIWTPYVSIQDMNLTIGQNSTFTQASFIMVWGHAASINATLAGHWYDQSMTYVPVTVGWKVHPLEIYSGGAFISSLTLHVTTIYQIYLTHLQTISASQSESDWDWILAHWYLLAILAGAVILMAAAFTKNWIFAVVGLALVGVGVVVYFLSGGLTGFSSLFWMGGLR